MDRDMTLFPADENGDALWEMAADGDNLEIEREIDFSVVFPTEDDALQFAVHLLRNEQKVSLAEYEGKPGFAWEVQVHPVMAASYENISGFEDLLEEESEQFNGENDGWACYSQSGQDGGHDGNGVIAP